MPALGMAQETGKLIAWLKAEGDHVEAGEPLMEVETDKTTVEVEAMGSGTLSNITAQPGDDVPVGEVVAVILAVGEFAPEPVQKQAAEVSEATAAPTPVVVANTNAGKSATPIATRMAAAHDLDLSQIPAQGDRVTRADVEAYLSNDGTIAGETRLLPASPKARRLVNENGYALTQIAGSGPGGAVLTIDVENFQPQPTLVQDQPTHEAATAIQEMSANVGQLWRRMAERLTESWQTVPHFYLKRDVNAQGLIDWRSGLKTRTDVKITFTDLLVKVVAAALKQHPHVNGSWRGDDLHFNDRVNVGLAVAIDEGLLVPVIHDADGLGVTAIAQRRAEIVERSLAGKLKPNDLQDGTFTISNLGMFGVDNFNAIVNPPQAAILAVGTIAEQVVSVNGSIISRPTLTLSLSCDHRAVDGARGARFLDTLATLIEDPMSLMD